MRPEDEQVGPVTSCAKEDAYRSRADEAPSICPKGDFSLERTTVPSKIQYEDMEDA